MKSQEIRETFLDFFKNKEHKIVPSAPMVVKDDPTLMFVNSGMAPFKEYFLGNGNPPSPRIADTQKCLRVSGKHNDLEEVGYDTYHHTFFEMMGNWSFGEYFKKEAIAWAWELLTEVFKISKDQLYVTVFEGSEEDQLPMDNEAFELWSQFVSKERILMGNKKDNFWEMGDQGPCGPCSEIHVDIRPETERKQKPGSELVNKDHPQVVEIWNLVFMQYNRKANGSLVVLPQKHIDTGMGFERLCMVLQGKTSNYDTDVFTPLISWLEHHTSIKYGVDEKSDIAMRVVCDHIRTVAFAIADGQLPSNTGAGYVIRRILRRAIRYGFTFLKQENPFMNKLVSVLTANMGDAFPELKDQQQLIENVIREEEHAFLRTLEQGLSMLNRVISESPNKKLSGTKVFELYDTFGFPVDLTALILRENGMDYDHQGFEKAMKEQKDRSRAAGESKTGDWIEISNKKEEDEFVGYDQLESDVYILRYRKVESKKDGTLFQLVFNKTPFYAEGGGQVGDKGYLEDRNGDVVYILDTKKENNVIIHITKNLPNHLEDKHHAVVETNQRFSTQRNHTATHLLHQALRKILGTHVEQKGSSVQANHLRFDFSHFSKVTSEELQEVEDFVNDSINNKLPLIEQRAIPMQKAIEEGAMALFGEKYGDKVRTIRFGDSIELCGGTHVGNTADIWYFKILSESAVAAGVRRIEAITGDAAKNYFKEQEDTIEQLKELIGNQKSPVKAVRDLQEENTSLQKEIDQLKKAMAGDIKEDLKQKIESFDNLNFLAQKVDLDPQAVKDVCYQLGNEVNELFVLLGSENNGKAMLTCYISKELVSARNLNAGTIVRELGKYIQGGGGGQAFFATAGGKNVDGIPQALEAARTYLT